MFTDEKCVILLFNEQIHTFYILTKGVGSFVGWGVGYGRNTRLLIMSELQMKQYGTTAYWSLHIYFLTNGVGDLVVGRYVGSAVGYE